MNRCILYVGIFLFSSIAQCANIKPLLIFIDGPSNLGKSTTAGGLAEHFKDNKIGSSSIDYHYALGLWGQLLSDSQKFISKNDSWDDLKLKLDENQGSALGLRDKFIFVKDFFTRIQKLSPWEALRKYENYDIAGQFLSQMRIFCHFRSVVIADIQLELLHVLNYREWERFLADFDGHVNIIYVTLLSDYPSYLSRFKCRNSSGILSDHRPFKASEITFNRGLDKAKSNNRDLASKFHAITIDVSEKSPAEVVNEIVLHIKERFNN